MVSGIPGAALARRCGACNTELSPSLLACPTCQRLVHGEQLTLLARDAEAATAAGRLSDALIAWRRAKELLPPESRQHQQISATVSALAGKVDEPLAGKKSPAPRWLAALGTVGLLIWKFKFVVALVLGKGKLLLLGLTKASTFFSMFASLGIYWSIWGWKFAVGLIASMYVHEMGHVAALRRYGIAASAPMFIPGLGALVRLKQYPNDTKEDARVGLAGPIWGLGAALVCYGIFLATDSGFFAATARVGAWLNLFNLLPIGSLDGGRSFRSLSRQERLLAAAAAGTAWFFSAEILLLGIALVGVARAFMGEQPKQGDRNGLIAFVVVVAALAFLAQVTTPIPAIR